MHKSSPPIIAWILVKPGEDHISIDVSTTLDYFGFAHGFNMVYPLVTKERGGKSPCSIGTSTIDGDF